MFVWNHSDVKDEEEKFIINFFFVSSCYCLYQFPSHMLAFSLPFDAAFYVTCIITIRGEILIDDMEIFCEP